jgi:hypothetical protein
MYPQSAQLTSVKESPEIPEKFANLLGRRTGCCLDAEFSAQTAIVGTAEVDQAPAHPPGR